MLELNDVKVSFSGGGVLTRGRTRIRAVKGVSFDISQGETFGLVGESGSGKSTVGRAILRLVPIDSGHIRFEGNDLADLGRRVPLSYRKSVQAVFQDPATSLDPRMLVGEILAEAIRRHSIVSGRTARLARVVELLDQVELASYFARRHPSELSGGQRQRVSIARALAVEPKFVVCDEIISALDVSTRGSIINLMRKLQDQFGISYLFIAHDLSVVHHISHRIGVMRAGELVEVGEASSVYSNPQHAYTQRLLEAEPLPDPLVQRQRRERRLLETGPGLPRP